MKFWLGRVGSPIGTMLLVSDGEALRALDFSDHEARMRVLLRRYCGEFVLEAGAAGEAGRHLEDYFDGDLAAPERIPVRTGGSDFQRRVWAELRKIPAGATSSYGRIAAAIGAPGASRAVGLANGANPVAIVVPCHRVIGADGSLTGYGGGLKRKAWLLVHERGDHSAAELSEASTAT
jgi:methylated-DNA-[protein]-cysteine S-methyltransferase